MQRITATTAIAAALLASLAAAPAAAQGTANPQPLPPQAQQPVQPPPPSAVDRPTTDPETAAPPAPHYLASDLEPQTPWPTDERHRSGILDTGRQRASARRCVGCASWYGWKTLAADVLTVGLGLGLAKAGASGEAVSAFVLGAFVVSAPTIHFAHGNTPDGVVSLAHRGGGLALGYVLIDGCLKRDGASMCSLLALPIVGGLVAAVPIDAFVRARGWVGEDGDGTHVSFIPQWDPNSGRVGLQAAGRF